MTKTKPKIKYYNLTKIHRLAPKADVYLIFGQRGNGKTTGVIKDAIDDYISSKYINRLL